MYKTEGNLAYQEELRTEVIGGQVVALAAPSSRHEDAADNIYNIFRDYLRGKLCRVFSSNRAVYLAEGEAYLPDVKVVCDRTKIKEDGIHGAPDLVVEVLSPSTGRYDRGRKMKVYESCGVREYWIVEPRNQTIEQYILEDGAFTLLGFYKHYTPEEWEYVKEQERAAAVSAFPCGIFDDLMVSLEKVFSQENW